MIRLEIRRWMVSAALAGTIMAMPVVSLAANRDLTVMPKVAEGSAIQPYPEQVRILRLLTREFYSETEYTLELSSS